MDQLTILITGVGGPTPRSFAIALKKYSSYKKYRFIATDSNPLAIGLYQADLFDKAYVVPKATDTTYWSVINKIVYDNNIDIAVILPEVEVKEWSRMQKSGALLPCKCLLPDHSMAETLIDKAKMTDFLKSQEVVPPSVKFHRTQINASDIGKSLGFPFWVRSASGTSGLGSLKVTSTQELLNWVDINPGVSDFLASAYLPGRNLACKLLYWNGRLLRSACAERINYIMAKVAPSGITGNTSFGRLVNEPKLVKIASEALEHLFAITKAKQHGFYTVDFKEDSTGKPFITEINVRHVAFTQCLAAAGANFAEDTIRLLDNDSTFDQNEYHYTFAPGLIFLRDVDALPIIMSESDLKQI